METGPDNEPFDCEAPDNETEPDRELLADFMLPVDGSMPPELGATMEKRGIRAIITPVVRDSFEPTGPTLFTHTGAYKGVDSIIRILNSGQIERFNEKLQKGENPWSSDKR